MDRMDRMTSFPRSCVGMHISCLILFILPILLVIMPRKGCLRCF